MAYYFVQGDEEPVILERVAVGDEAVVLTADDACVLELSDDSGLTWTEYDTGGSVVDGGDGYWYARFQWQQLDTDDLVPAGLTETAFQARLRVTRDSNGNTLSVPNAAPWIVVVVSR